MTQDSLADQPDAPEGAAPSTEPPALAAADVAFVLPAPAYESVATELDATPAVVVITGWADAAARSDDAGRQAVEAVRSVGERLERRLEELKALFEREGRAEASREKVVDRLHAELQEYKQDFLLSTLRPIFIDLIQLHDDIGKVATAAPEAEGDGLAETRRLAALMEGFRQGIEDILYRQGVEPYHVEGNTFDPRRQRAVATVACDDPSQNRSVAARHRKGFRAGERVVRPEIVSVFALKK